MKKFFSLSLFSLLLCGVQSGVVQAQDKSFTNSIGMEFVLIPAGQSIRAEGLNDFGEEAEHQVSISQPFYLGKYEVTQEQWVAVMGTGSNPSIFKGRTNPVENVSWDDVQVFIQKLNEKEGDNKYRLPTEAEWEHAARAGSETKWFFGSDPNQLGKYAWFKDNSAGTTHPVGEKQPNPWGLYDIYGNVWEWVQDWYGEYPEGAMMDPTGPASGSARIYRGGSWFNPANSCRSAYRGKRLPGYRRSHLGFRLAFSSPPRSI